MPVVSGSGCLLALPSRGSPCQAEALRYAPKAGRVVGVAVERACRNRTAQQAGTKQSPRLASDLGADVTWQKSSWSAHNGSCVEVASLPEGELGVRDSKDEHGPALVFGRSAWSSFLADVKKGRFDIG